MNYKRLQFIAVILVVAVIGMVYAKKMMNSSEQQDAISDTVTEILDQNWETRKIAETGLILFVPEKMKHIPTKLDENAKETLDAYAAYEYNTEPFILKVNHITAKYDLSSAKYAEQLNAMIKASGDIRAYESETIPFSDENLKGTFVKGEGFKGDYPTALRSAILERGDQLWEITVVYVSTNEQLAEKAKEIISSIQIQ
jgi:hypothetical protein